MIAEKREGNVRGIREDGRSASFALERIGRVYAPIYRLKEEFIEEAFADVRKRSKELAIPESRLRNSQLEQSDALNVLEDRIEAILPDTLDEVEKLRCTQALWSLLEDADDLQRSTRRIESLREEVWQPFEQRARVLAAFG